MNFSAVLSSALACKRTSLWRFPCDAVTSSAFLRSAFPCSLLTGVLLVAQMAPASAQVNRVAIDTVFVRGNTAPAWGANVALTQVFRIGMVNGPKEYAFGRITSFAVDRRGRFYLYDTDDLQVRAYDTNGNFLRLIGRAGMGPGEYQSVVELDVAGDTLLTVFDDGGRITHFQPDSKIFKMLEMSRISGGDRYLGSDNAGTSYVRVPIVDAIARKLGVSADMIEVAPSPGQVSVRHQYLLFRVDGVRLDSILLPPFKDAFPKPFHLRTAEGETTNFVNAGFAAPSPAGGVVFGFNDSYRFAIKPLRGPTIVVERPWTPLPVAGEERANYQLFVDFYKAQGSGTFTIPAVKPAFNDLFADRDGRVWVSLYTAAERRDIPPRPAGNPAPLLLWRQRLTFDVFDKAGTYLGRIALKPNARMLDAQGDRLYVLERGADDVESVVCYRIGGASR